MIGKLHGFDIREKGSGNAGTTNAIRTLGTKWGLITFAGDFLKSYLAVVVVGLLFSKTHADILPLLKMYAGAGAILSHDYPFYLNFRGGKGVAASAGCLAGFDPLLLIGLFSAFLIVAIATGYVSAGSLTAYGLFTPAVTILGLMGRFHMTQPHLIELDLLVFALSVLCWWQHRENLKRLAAGTERKTTLFKRKE